MLRRVDYVAFVALVGCMAALAAPSFAQSSADTSSATGSAFPDTPSNHWAYQAVQDLANKGLVKGYPNGKFLGSRDMTRYEFATVIDRLLQTISDIDAAHQANPTVPVQGEPAVTQDDLNQIQVLVDTFKDQLTAIQDDVTKEQGEIEDLRQDVLDTKAEVKKAQDTANASYGFGSNRKFSISGYIQARYIDSQSSSTSRFPNGSPAANSPVNGNYAQNGAPTTLELRRVRLKVAGTLTANTKYAIQLDASGVSNPVLASTPTALNANNATAVTLREAHVDYTPGDGSSKYPTISAGQIAQPFGYVLGLSTSACIFPERPLAFNEGGNGIFNSQDWVRGVGLTYGPSTIHLSLAEVNSNGYLSNNLSNVFDEIGHLYYQSKDKVYQVGVSYLQGQVDILSSGASVYSTGREDLEGADAEITLPSGPFINSEYLQGRYDALAGFNGPNAIKVSTLTSGPVAGIVNGNDIEGYYVLGGYTFNPAGNHPLSLAYDYDVLQRAQGGPLKNATYDDVNNGYGVLYNLDKQTRLRVWYTEPIAVAHEAGTVAPPKIALFTSEVQVKF